MNENDMLSPWARNVSPSPTLAVDAKAKELKAAGEDVCGFGAGEPDFDTPEFIKDACAKALADGLTKYAPAGGIPALRKALAEQYHGLGVLGDANPAQVVISPGGKYSCHLAILATCGPGDEVIIPAPYWVSYPEMVKLAGATPKIVFAGDDQGFKVSAQQIADALTPNSKLIILNSPSNPTGCLYEKAEMEAILQLACEKDLLLMSDEIYEYLLYDDASHHRPASFDKEAAERVITVSGFSKTFSMTGWRLGTLVANPTISKAVGSLQSQTTSNATTFAQYGALAAMQNWEQSMQAVNDMLVHFDRRRLKLLDGLNSIEGITCLRSQGAFYLFPRVSSFGLSSEEFSGRLLDEEKVAVVSGHAFGADGYIRLSYATSDEIIEEGLRRISHFCTAFA
ncbi:MAG: pyridoxal phosphate-dependent aminotransferase [Verrucomicrobiota bacterium]|nr:pyridoxal phosphate-dependent aminotransferase [Verrucomicrobiota bacterium]